MDDRITSLLAADCDAGFERIVALYQDRLYAFTLALTRCPEDAEEAAQDALVRAHRALCRYEPERRAELQVNAWLHRIALNVVRNRVRRRRAPTVALTHDVAADPRRAPEASSERRDTAARLRAALAGLPGAQREAVVLRHVQGMAYAEAAAVLGAPVGTVKSNVHRGLALLRDMLEEENEG